jgi:hypothetical protein
MSTGLKHNSAADGLDITNKAAHSKPRDSQGRSLTQVNNTAQPSLLEVLPTAGVNGSVVRANRADGLGSLASALHNPLFTADFEGAVLNAMQFIAANTTFAPAQATGQYSFNPTNLTTVSAVSTLITLKRFKKLQRVPMQAKFRLRYALVANSSCDFGFGLPAAAAQVTNGAYFQVTTGGVLQGVLTYNSVDVPVTITPSVALDPLKFYVFDIVVEDDEAKFFIQDTETEAILAEVVIRVPRGSNRMWLDSHLPVFARLLNSATLPASAPVFVLTDVMVTALDAMQERQAPFAWAQMGYGAAASPLTGVQLAQFVNSADPTNATLSNTSAAYSSLGGLFGIAMVAGALTDYCLFAFQVPAPYDLIVTGISIEAMIKGAANATTLTVLEWFAVHNAAAASLAGVQVREFLGMQNFALTDPVGTVARRIQESYVTPRVTNAGRFIVIAVRIPVGTTTASEVIHGGVKIEGYFE